MVVPLGYAKKSIFWAYKHQLPVGLLGMTLSLPPLYGDDGLGTDGYLAAHLKPS
jgi:hypothetical protein